MNKKGHDGIEYVIITAVAISIILMVLVII